jgi:predicted nuclease of predicted toxin-antitoxin system
LKLLFDQNLSFRLVEALKGQYPGSTHVRLLGMERADDTAIWHYAKDNGFVIVTRDADFNERSVMFGYPPKIVWINSGNSSTEHILAILERHRADLSAFGEDVDSGCLELY